MIRDDLPEYFSDGSSIINFFTDTIGMYTARDFSKVTLRNNKFNINGQWLSLKF